MGKGKERMRKRTRKTKEKKEEKESGKNEGKRVGERKWKRGIMNGKNAKIIFQEEKKIKFTKNMENQRLFKLETARVYFILEALVKLEIFYLFQLLNLLDFDGSERPVLLNFRRLEFHPFFRNLTPSSGETEYSGTKLLNSALPEPEIHTSIFGRTNTWLLGFRFDGTLDGFQTCT
ncbi:unnamed protein product [Rhizophagus irregularis]|nr:unnamed protein product [Rhizophagus irregularis]